MEMPKSLTHKLAVPIFFLFTLALGAGFVLAGESSERTPNDSGTPQAPKTATPEKKAASSDALEALEAKVAQQQSQIERLTRALELLNQRLNETSKSPAAAPPNSVGPVASLTLVIPSSSAGASAMGPISGKTSPAPVPSAEPGAPEEKQSKLSDLAFGKIKIGGTFYGDYAYYTATGFGPQFLTQINQAGPGNDGFNSVDINRTYINVLYTPNDAITLRITPNIYRQVDVSGATGFGKGAAVSSSSNGNLGFRLKYAYVDFKTLFSGSESFSKDKLTIGQLQNPLVDWEEGLYGYRYVNLVPWNYLSLSSTYVGTSLHGPIEWNGKEYLDYDLAVFNTASFHAIEQNDKKQVMGRLTWYPAGTTNDRTGFGLTAFMDYGYSTKTPDTRSIPLYRFATLVHYQTHSKNYLIAGEYDLGRNAFSTGNLFSGVGPADEFGLGPTRYANFDAMAKAFLGGDHTRQQGFDFFGHARIPKSRFAVFGMFEYFQPNTNVNHDPLDFRRTIGGISYRYNEHFEIALDDQNLTYSKGQFTFPSSELARFSPSLAKANPMGISNAVPQNTNAVFVNLLFNY